MKEEKELRARVPYGTTQAQTGGNEGGGLNEQNRDTHPYQD